MVAVASIQDDGLLYWRFANIERRYRRLKLKATVSPNHVGYHVPDVDEAEDAAHFSLELSLRPRSEVELAKPLDRTVRFQVNGCGRTQLTSEVRGEVMVSQFSVDQTVPSPIQAPSEAAVGGQEIAGAISLSPPLSIGPQRTETAESHTHRRQTEQRFGPTPQIMAKKHVFLSYCRDNAAEVAKLRDDLIAAGESAWWDQDITGGQDWKFEIRKAMKDAYAVLLCLSAESEKRVTSGIYPEALDAIGAYREYAPGSIFLIPVRLSDCKIPPIELDGTRTLDRLQYVDLYPDAKYADGVRRLVHSIRAAPNHP